MKDPCHLTQHDRLQLLNHLFELGELEFHHWRTANGNAREPVPFTSRYWAATSSTPADSPAPQDVNDFEAKRTKALAAHPTAFATPVVETASLPITEAALPPATGAVLAAAAPPDATLPQARLGYRAATGASGGISHVDPSALSPFGSARSQNIHSGDLWQEDDLIAPPTFANIIDPDDVIPSGASTHWNAAPIAVPVNAEAKGQWAFSVLDNPDLDEHFPISLLRQCAVLLAELPVRTFLPLIHMWLMDLACSQSRLRSKEFPEGKSRCSPTCVRVMESRYCGQRHLYCLGSRICRALSSINAMEVHSVWRNPLRWCRDGVALCPCCDSIRVSELCPAGAPPDLCRRV